MKKRQKIFLLTGEQWLGVCILALLAGVTLFLVHRFQPAEPEVVEVVSDSVLTQFATYQAEQDSIRKATWKKQYPRDTLAIRMQVFDPNTADSSTLVHLGLKKWQVSNMLKYRAKGGRYRKAEDMKRLYGMTDSMYVRLLPYIHIDTAAIDQYRDSLRRSRRDTLAKDSVPRYVSQKRDTLLNLRTADTTELKKIRGIGSYRARQIVRYRKELGGFVNTEQLREIKALQPLLTDSLQADSLLSHFWIDSIIIVPLQVNSCRAETLERHPYLSFEQAKAVYELRRKKIRLESIEQLRRLDCFTEEELRRVEPYLSFEVVKR
ncbi:MAG: helix-hairpin-helix domain-containing protein [Bacteroidaceae bacterium]|nr:helix-hairpin-helix domain-containing protein [Bacteroidaceae bacterium]